MHQFKFSLGRQLTITLERNENMKLNIQAFALASGLLWGVGLFTLTWWVLWLEGPSPTPTLLTRIYPGYNMTPVGSIIGLAWGFVDALIGGAVFAWFYNALCSKF